MLRSPGHDNVNNIITTPENGPEFLAASAASATAAAASATASTVAQQQPPRKRRRYRRAPETRLSEATRASLRVEIDKSHSNARAKSTMDTYVCYKRAIDPWYHFNQPELTIDGKLNCAKIREECRTLEGLQRNLKIFKEFLKSRPHLTRMYPDGTSEPARVGSLMGYRSAFGYFVWTHNMPCPEGAPKSWNSSMREFISGEERKERERMELGDLPNKVGKDRMGVRLFRQIGKYYMEEGEPSNSFAHSASWNLMQRKTNILKLHCTAFTMDQDSMAIGLTKTKTKKKGHPSNDVGMLKHCYANPFEPEVSGSSIISVVRRSL